MNKEKVKKNFKRIRPFIGIILMLSLIFICTGIVFFSVASCLMLPFLWVVFIAIHYLKPNSYKITYCLNAVRLAMWVYFSTIFLFLVYRPHWLEVWSEQLERHSWWNVFAKGSYMYGRTSLAFAFSSLILIVSFVYYKRIKKKKQTETTNCLTKN